MNTDDKSPWPTHCHELPFWDTANCCPSCHDDAYEYGIEPCEIEVNGETKFVCCKCAIAMPDSPIIHFNTLLSKPLTL